MNYFIINRAKEHIKLEISICNVIDSYRRGPYSNIGLKVNIEFSAWYVLIHNK